MINNSAAITFLRKNFAWYDGRQHFWVLERSIPSWFRFFTIVATIGIVPVGLFVLLLGIQILSSKAAAVLGVLATLWFLLRYLQFLPLAVLGTKSTLAVTNVGFKMRPALALAVLAGWTFLVVSQDFLWWERGSLGSLDESYSLAQWSAFFWNQALNILLLDIPSMVRLFDTPIEPQSLTAHIVMALWGLFFTVGVVESVLLVFDRNLGQTAFYGTVSDCWEECAIDPDDELLVQHHSSVDPLQVVYQSSIHDIHLGLLLDELMDNNPETKLRQRLDTEEV